LDLLSPIVTCNNCLVTSKRNDSLANEQSQMRPKTVQVLLVLMRVGHKDSDWIGLALLNSTFKEQANLRLVNCATKR
jgi:hypothetical protein